MNNLLSREEFSQYSQRTGDDEVGDEEWNVVKGTVINSRSGGSSDTVTNTVS